MSEDVLYDLKKRLHVCQTVSNDIKDSYAWKVLLEDLEDQRKTLDDNWQNITNYKELQEARILKLAIAHIVNLVNKYDSEKENLTLEISEMEDKETVIHKDYDGETLMEEESYAT